MKAMKLSRSDAAMLIVDIQERLLPAVSNSEQVLANAVRLVKGAEILNVPVLVTEQYPKGLGPTVEPIKSVVRGFAPFEKVAFSSCEAAGFMESLKRHGRSQVVLSGVEAHVCVLQTCLDLLSAGFTVFVAADAVSSRTPENLRLALERMQASGATLVSTEMVLFELLGRAGTPEFKLVQALIK